MALVALALAAGVVLPSPPTPPDQAALERAAADLAAVAAAFRAHHVDTGRWPDLAPGQERVRMVLELADLGSLVEAGAGLPGWDGPYLEPDALGSGGTPPLDPWGRPYLAFHLPGTPGAIRLVSAGPDRRLETGPDDVAAGRVRGDDLTALVSRMP